MANKGPDHTSKSFQIHINNKYIRLALYFLKDLVEAMNAYQSSKITFERTNKAYADIMSFIEVHERNPEDQVLAKDLQVILKR